MEEITLKVPAGKIRIKKGYCPHGCSLIDPDHLFNGRPSITLKGRLRGTSGLFHFNPFYGIFEYESELEVQNGDNIDFYCPHCETSLSVEEMCGLCHIPMFAVQLPDGGEVRACPMVGCRNHHLTIVDLDAQFALLYNEERRPKM